MANKIDTLLFDFDGTIVNTNNIVILSWKEVYTNLLNLDFKEEDIFDTFGEPLEKSFQRKFPNEDQEKLLLVYRDFHEKHFKDSVYIYDGFYKGLKYLKDEGFKLAIITSRAKESLIFFLKYFDIIDCFDVVITSDDTSIHKPEPEPIFLGLEMLNSKPENSLMVGDSVFDLLCAKNANVMSVLVGWSQTVPLDSENIKYADLIINDISDLISWIKNNNHSL